MCSRNVIYNIYRCFKLVLNVVVVLCFAVPYEPYTDVTCIFLDLCGTSSQNRWVHSCPAPRVTVTRAEIVIQLFLSFYSMSSQMSDNCQGGESSKLLSSGKSAGRKFSRRGLNRYFSSIIGVKSKNLAVSARLYGKNKKISPARGGGPGPTLPISAGAPVQWLIWRSIGTSILTMGIKHTKQYLIRP